MLTFDQVLKYFVDHGAVNHLTSQDLQHQLVNTDVFIFDWDGVFNNGEKKDDKGSSFSEPDSMGTNLMRLSYFLKYGKMPKMGVITGAVNEGSKFLAEREKFDFIIRGFHNKSDAIGRLKNEIEVSAENALFMWDDLIDYPIAKWVKTGIQVKRAAHPQFNAFMLSENCTSYVTSSGGDHSAVRELSELYLSAMGNAKETFLTRAEHADTYSVYLEQKRSIKTIEIIR